MKKTFHGGIKAFFQTAAKLQKFMRHLRPPSAPFIDQKINFLEPDFGPSWFVDHQGQLQVIDRSYQYN